MKQFIAILAAAIVGGTSTFVLTRETAPPREEREANDSHLATLAALRSENQSLKAKANQREIITVEVPAKAQSESLPNAAHHLTQLQTLQATDGRTKRRAVHYFESLVDIGEDALPPIEEFRNDYPDHDIKDREKELTAKEIFTKYIIYFLIQVQII